MKKMKALKNQAYYGKYLTKAQINYGLKQISLYNRWADPQIIEDVLGEALLAKLQHKPVKAAIDRWAKEYKAINSLKTRLERVYASLPLESKNTVILSSMMEPRLAATVNKKHRVYTKYKKKEYYLRCTPLPRTQDNSLLRDLLNEDKAEGRDLATCATKWDKALNATGGESIENFNPLITAKRPPDPHKRDWYPERKRVYHREYWEWLQKNPAKRAPTQ